jgi:hypothetical protein
MGIRDDIAVTALMTALWIVAWWILVSSFMDGLRVYLING